MNAEIISIGTELLLGEINDTNATYLAQQCKNIGLNLFYRSTVGDNEARICDVIKLAMSRADIIITTGGLGPTVDDMTRQAVACAVGQELTFRQELMDDIEKKFAGFQSRMTANNRTQAFMPERAIVVNNPVGTAPSFIVETEQGAIISLPGVPREMKYLMENAIMPYLRQKIGAVGVLKLRILRTAAAGESWLGEQIDDLMRLNNPTVGTAAHAGQTDIRITVRAEDDASADVLIAEVEAKVRARVGKFIFGVDKETIDAALIGELKSAGWRLIVSETGTGGSLSKRLNAQPDIAAVVAATEGFADSDALRAHLASGDAPSAVALAEAAAIAARRGTENTLAVAVVADKAQIALSVYDGEVSRSRAYGYGIVGADAADAGIAEWIGGWGIAMAWLRLTERAEKEQTQQIS